MRRLSAFAWRSLAARRLRTALTIGGVAIGVAVLFAALATNAGIDASIDRTVSAMLGRADMRVSAFEERGLTEPTTRAVSSTPGVALAAPAIERRTYPQLRAGAPVGELPPPVTVLGIDPSIDLQVHDQTLASGVGLSAGLNRSALITETLAKDEHVGLGDELTLLGAAESGPQPYKIVGILAGDGPLPAANGRLVMMPIEAARALFALDGISRLDIRLAPGADPAVISAALEARLTREPYVLSTPVDVASSLRSSTAGFQATMALVAAIALFVGAFLIFNTLSMTVVERIREVALLRIAGARSGQINRLFLLQALFIGVVGSVIGIGIGFALAAAMASYVRASKAAPLDAPSAPPAAIALVFAIGVLVTLAAALEPAWRAGRIAPVEALRARADAGTSVGARLRWLVAVFAAIALAGLLVWPHVVSATTGGGGAASLASFLRPLLVYGLLLVAALLSPFVLPILGRVAGWPLTLILRTEERLARSAIVRDRSRTALTVGALAIGLAMIVAVGMVTQGARQAASDWLTEVIPGSEILTSIRPVALDEPQRQDLAAVSGVERVSPMATFGVAFRGVRLDATAVVGADLLADGRLTMEGADRATALNALDAGGSVILPRSEADRLGLRVGDEMPFATGSTSATLRVSGIVERTLPGQSGESILVGWQNAQRTFGVEGADLFAVRYAPGREVEARPALDRIARSYALEPSGLDSVRSALSDALGRVFGLFDVLALIAVIVAGLGIVNTLMMSVVERVREIGVLRATGMTRRQVYRMVVVEAALLGVAGAIVGCLSGLAVGAVLLAIGGSSPLTIEVPWRTIALAGAFGIATAMLASVYPARLASGVSIVRAVQQE